MLNFSLGRMRVFLAVAETESISAAADRLSISQPAVSATVAALSKDFGAPLIRREGRRIRLTAAGDRLQVYGRQLFALLDDAADEVRALGGSQRATVRVAAVTTAAEALLPPILGKIRESMPHLEIALEVSTRPRVWERLAAREVHVAIGGSLPADRPFRSMASKPNEIVIVAPPGSTASAVDLAAQTWLLREPGSGTRGLAREFFDTLEIEPANQLTIGSNAAIRECVRVGLGISLVSRDSVRRDLEAGTLIEVPTPFTPLHRFWHVVVNEGYRVPPAAAAFITAVAHQLETA